ncbi:MAG: glycosyl hydrolase [Bacteroidota bacterium]
MKKNYILTRSGSASRLLLPALLSICVLAAKAQNPNLPAKGTLSQTVLSAKTFSNGTAVDTVVKPFTIANSYTLEVVAKVNSATGRGLDIEARNAGLKGFRLSLDAASLKWTAPLNPATTLSASNATESHTIRVAVRNDSAHIYQNGSYLLSKPVATVKDIDAGVETDQLFNATTGPTLISNWAGTAPNNTGKPSDYGWAYTGTTNTTFFAVANSTTAGTCRYMDVSASSGSNLHTYNSATYIGRLLYLRWDGSATQGTVFSYPVTLEANTTYDFSMLTAYISNATGNKTMTVGIGKTVAATERYASKVFTTTGTRVLKKDDFYFSSQEAGQYYITVTGDWALMSVGELSLNKLVVNPRFIFGKDYITGAVNMEISSVTYDDGAWAPAAPVTLPRQSVTLTGNTVQIPTTFNTDFTVPGKTDVHFTAEYTPFANSSIALNSNDAWLFFDNIRPSKVISDWLPLVTVNGATAVNNTNVRIAVYKNGTVVIPNGNLTSQAALEVFTAPNLGGSAQTYAIQVINNNLGAFNNTIRSFKLKRGYMATFANNPDGSGYSRVFIANDSDLVVNTMPAGLEATASFIRVVKWNWPSKKGKAGWSPDKINSTWYYDWNIGGSAADNYDYSAIRQTQYWPAITDISNKQNINHVLGFNEPDRPDQANMTVEQAFNAWPELMKTGLRIGSPAPASPGNSWITDFLRKTDSANYRVDYVAIHCYWGGQTPQQWYNQLKAIYDRVKRPLWITEWNNGANWTTETWPTDPAAQLQKQYNDMIGILNVLDTTSFIERYAEYDWVENKRALVLADTLTPAGKYYAANKSDFAYNPAKAFTHTWKLVSPRIYSTINNSDYFKVTLNWNDLNGELGSKYVLERKIDGRDADFIAIQDFTGYAANGGMNYKDSVYVKASYRLKAVALDGIAFAYSSTLDITRDIAPVAPASLTGDVISSSRIRLNWNAGTNVRSYNLKRSLNAAGPWDTIAARTTALTYLDSTLSPATTYYYVVTTLNSAGESANSTVLSKATPALVIPVGAINPRIASGDTKVTLTWDFQYDAKYKILRSETENGTYDTVVVNLDALRFEDNGRTNNTNYYYKMIAYNPAGISPLSPVLIAKPILGQHLHMGFNENTGTMAKDDWGGYNGLLRNAATWTPGKDSATGAIKLIKDSSSYIQLENGVVSTLSNFTMASWLKMPANQASNTRLFDFGTSTTNFMMLSPRYVVGGVPGVRYKITAAAGTFQPVIPYDLPLDTWVHVVISQKDSVFKFYVNGTLQYTDSTDKVKPSDLGITTQNYIGRSVWSTDPYCDHAYDDFRIYNYAVSDQNVAELYLANQSLPIRLMSFDGKATGQGNLLNWKLTTEGDATRVELEKGSDARNFSSIYSLTTAENNNVQSFSFTDSRISGAINYYRLKMIETNGRTAYSPVVAIINNVKGIELVGLYPTLVNNGTVLSVAAAKQTTIRTVVTDMFGRTLQAATHQLVTGSSLLTIDASRLAAGVYHVSLFDGDRKLGQPARFVVAH